jgi:SAM-dependent methyltransferase
VDRRAWERRYAGAERLWSLEPNRFLVEATRDLPVGSALDLGTGEGCDALWLAGCGWQVTAVDFSVVALSRARALAGARGIRVDWIAVDLLSYEPPRAAFDLVVMLYVHLPPPARSAVLERAAGALTPGGHVLVVGFDRSNLTQGCGGPRDPALLFTPEEIAHELPSVEVVRAERVSRTEGMDGDAVTTVSALVWAVKPPHLPA